MSPVGGDGFRLSMSPRLSLQRVGAEQEPVIVVDGLMRDPAALVEAAAQAPFRPAWSPEGGYPGLRAPAPETYVARVVKTLSPMIARAFELPEGARPRAAGMFSLVTLPPDRLAPFQRIPHVDTDDPFQLAWLHYLCAPEQGGTAFYRHRTTGFEAITAERRAPFEAARDRELAQAPPDAAYPLGDTPHFEQTAAIDARFDRLIIYRSRLLHSGRILSPATLTEDPRRGRLTANLFVVYGGAGAVRSR